MTITLDVPPGPFLVTVADELVMDHIPGALRIRTQAEAARDKGPESTVSSANPLSSTFVPPKTPIDIATAHLIASGATSEHVRQILEDFASRVRPSGQ